MVDYSYYTGVYYGDVVKDPTEFIRLSRIALRDVNRYTFNRASNLNALNRHDEVELTELIKMTICELIDTQSSRNDYKGVKSKKVDDLSITYESDTEEQTKSKMYDIIMSNLSHTGLLYRGVDRC